MAVDVKYTAEALATGGGREGKARTADGALDLTMAPPKELGGSGEGINPEQLFATGWAACFLGATKKVAGDDYDTTDASVGVKVSIGADDDGGFGLAAEIEVVLPKLDQAAAEELAEKAHAFCPYSKATRGNIEVKVTAAQD
ncbi:organic hydroperoxide resistance protein [Nesterenkonia alkaliphila]|uniref:Ohr family peroxiredoxin n=1 Tax=Nesterenkonia alkaliphila TaxID=1463631 RepID=A0A7K1UEV0_9MICC|nr:organic hydroperoxide resistance protein [Nesterenkonia alkaliphila]MVT24914.1 Ohr family peroxiredoxin [Nesterenkonia alkaliphila]GFZ86683.1 putative organic hydroperoxide resistance protein/OsmC-like protein [Nesterenkonia alkaliphila]